jgi:hypothetical protein
MTDKTEINIDGVTYVKKEKAETKEDANGNIDCENVVDCRNCVECNNSTSCDNSTWCDNSMSCNNSTRCNNSTWCNNSTSCDNSTWCDNSAYCLYCCDLTLEKFMVFNQSVGSKKEFIKILEKYHDGVGYYTHPKQLTKENIAWMKKNIKQFDQKVLDKIIKESILPEKPKDE